MKIPPASPTSSGAAVSLAFWSSPTLILGHILFRPRSWLVLPLRRLREEWTASRGGTDRDCPSSIGCGGNNLGAMGHRLIRGLSGAAVFLVSVALLSVRHRGAQETARYPGLREGMSGKPERRSKASPEDGGSGRGQKDLQVHPPEGYRTEGSLTLGDIFIAVKTTKRFHQSRMELLLDTWISRAREQVSVWIWTREGGVW